MLSIINFIALILITFGKDFQVRGANAPVPVPVQTFDDFKVVMMYFNEPFLTDAHVTEIPIGTTEHNEHGIEGANGLAVAIKFSEIILNRERPEPWFQQARWFAERLQVGARIFGRIINNESENASRIQTDLITELNNHKTIIVPASWKKHAIVLIFSKNGNQAYDLIIVNTGDGLENHRWYKDPTNAYFSLPRLWLKFEGIPSSILFPQNTWFVKVLRALNNDDTFKDIASHSGSLKNYFYKSILHNFKDFLVKPENSQEKLIPAQRSGTCTVSSLLASYLYFAKNELEFHLTNLVIGHELLEKFLLKYENNIHFKTLITDGYDLTARKIFRFTSASLARQALLYLEQKFPESFKNSGLIGPNRNNWIWTKKTDAFKKLSKSSQDLKLLRKTIELGLKIEKIISHSPINERTRNIVISQTETDQTPNFYYSDINMRMSDVSGNVTLVKRIDRPLNVVSSLKDIAKSIEHCLKSSKTGQILVCAQDAFEQVNLKEKGATKWWDLIDSTTSLLDITDFLDQCQKLVKHYISLSRAPDNLDDLVVLAHLQIAFWKGTIKYDEFMDEEQKLGLNKFKPPNILHAALDQFAPSFTSGSFTKWPLATVFSPKSIEKLKSLLDDYSQLTDGSEEFFGPSNLIGSDSNNLRIDFVYNNLKVNRENFELYEKIFNHSRISELIEEEREKGNDEFNGDPNDWLLKDYVKLTVILARLDDLKDYFPQFQILMNNLMWIYKRVGSKPFKLDEYFHHGRIDRSCIRSKIEYKTPSKLSLNIAQFNSEFIFNQSPDKMISRYSELIKRAKGDIFFEIRHSQSLSPPDSVVNFEAWMNYIKGSKDSKIFDSPYFMYLSNYVLNMPKVSDNIEINKDKLYPRGLSSKSTVEVFDELGRLISHNLNILLQKKGQLAKVQKRKLVRKATNIAIILVRFIGRIDHDNIISGNRAAKMLADLYIKIQPFGQFNSGFELDESEISTINLVLAQICDLDIRNSKYLVESIANILPFKGATKLYRRTLSRFHHFVVNMNYILSSESKNHADDLYSRGSIYMPIQDNEVEFSDALLRGWLLPKFTSNLVKSKISYGNQGDIAAIEFTENRVKNIVGMHFSTGFLVINGVEVINRDKITNNEKFRKYFETAEEKMQASNGVIGIFGDIAIYYLKDYKIKGNEIAMICNRKEQCELFRKIGNFKNNYWFKWLEDKATYASKINYNWIKGYKYYSTEESGVFIKDDEVKPLYMMSERTKFTVWRQWGNQKSSGTWDIEIYSKQFMNNYQKHLRRFTDTEMILAKKYKLTSIIYPGLRLKEDPKTPLILVAKHELRENCPLSFEVFNSSDLFIDSDQNSFNSTGIMGTLVASNKDGYKFLLAPIAQFEQESTYEPLTKRLEIRYIEKIPILDNVPIPQTRLQRLLLAYYCIAAREFNLARELLHPFTSINQNEVFSMVEVETIRWIISNPNSNIAVVNGPEAASLRLMAIMHLHRNSKKFPLDYKGDEQDEGKSLNNFRQKALNEAIMERLPKDVIVYFESLRDLAEKYLIHKIFPEFFNDEISSFFNYASSVRTNNEEVIGESMDISFFDGPIPGKEFDKVNASEINWVLETRHNGNQSQLREYLDYRVRVLHKMRENQSCFRGNESFIICAYKQINLFDGVASVFEKMREEKDGNKRLKIVTDAENEFNSCIQKCKSDYPNEFIPLVANEGSETNSVQSIIDNLKADAEKNHNIAADPGTLNYKPVKEIDLKIFGNIIKDIKSLLNPNRVKFSMGFSQHNLKLSKVLRKLSGSIDNFVEENGQYKSLEVPLHDKSYVKTVSSLKKLRFYLESRICDLKDQEHIMALNLANDIGASNPNMSEAHSFEVINRLMHQRKQKSFSNLYSCYQKLSISCIQHKFPQLSLERCKRLFAESMQYYSNHILIEFLSTILEFVEKFLKSQLSKSSVSVDDLLLFLDEAEKVTEFNERIKSPSVLNFEYRSKKYRLRKEQVQDIEHLTTIDPNTGLFRSAVIQRMMAAGKTLVLGTIAVVKKAINGKALSILVPPSSLYQSNLSSMQTRTYSFFKKRGDNFIFPRFTFERKGELEVSVIPYLTLILKSIETIIEEKDYYVLSPDSLQSFLNSYVELIYFDANNRNGSSVDQTLVSSALMLYAKIYEIFRTKSSIILDEIDMTMDPKKELNFPTSETEPLNMIAAALMTDLIEFSVFDEEVRKIGLDILGNNQSGFTESNYKKYVGCLHRYIGKQLDDSMSVWSQNLLDKSFKSLNKESIVKFLSNPEIDFMKEWIKEIIISDRLNIANALVIVKVQMNKNLQDSFKGTANLNFGIAGSLRPTVEYAIPYLAANTPSPSSEFADRWETLVKTLLTLASVSSTEGIARNMIVYLRQRIIDDTSLEVKYDETTMFKNINVLVPGIDILNMNEKDDSDVKLVHDALKTRSPAAIRILFSYALDKIFSQMKFPIEQITSNALNMTSMFGSIQGYSGTIDNVNILPREVIDAAYVNHMQNEKNNGGITLKLIKDSRSAQEKDRTVYQISDSDLRNPVKHVIKKMVQDALPENSDQAELSALIDAGAFFKNYKNREVSQGILENFERIKAVLYYDEDSNQVEFIKRITRSNYEIGFLSSTDPDTILKATQTEINHRFTFYDQRHITGSDILQPKTARALMTVGTRVLLRDILQGTLRMRQFMTSQKVHLITSEAAAKFYFSKVDPKYEGAAKNVYVTDIISLGALNEDEKQLFENEKLAFAKIDNEIRRFVLDEINRAILTTTNGTEIISAWFGVNSTNTGRNIRDLFVRLIKETPFFWMNKASLNTPAIVLSKYADFWIQKIKAVNMALVKSNPDFDVLSANTISGKRFKALETVLKSMVQKPRDENDKVSLLAFTEENIAERDTMIEGGGQVEIQVFTQQLTEMNLDNLVQNAQPNPVLKQRSPFVLQKLISKSDKSDLGEFNEPNFVSLRKVLYDEKMPLEVRAKARSAIVTSGKRLGVSRDLVEIVEKTPVSYESIFSEHTKEGSHILIQVLPEGKGIRAILLSTEAANEVRSEMTAKSFNANDSIFWLCDLSGTIKLTNDPKAKLRNNVMEFLNASRELIFDLLVFNGSFDHILKSTHLKTIYETKWLKHESFKLRAIFLLLRMKVLRNKEIHTFALDDPDLKTLKRASIGDKDAKSGTITEFGLFKKPAINEDVEKKFFSSTRMPRPKVAKADGGPDLVSVFRMIFKSDPNSSSEIVINDEMNGPVEEKVLALSPEVDASTGDDDLGIVPRPAEMKAAAATSANTKNVEADDQIVITEFEDKNDYVDEENKDGIAVSNSTNKSKKLGVNNDQNINLDLTSESNSDESESEGGTVKSKSGSKKLVIGLVISIVGFWAAIGYYAFIYKKKTAKVREESSEEGKGLPEQEIEE